MKQKWIGLVLAIIAFILGMTLPIEGLSQQGTMALFTLIGAVCLWVCGTLPLAISGLGCMLVLIVTGVGTASEVVGNFMNTAVLFLIYCFAFGTVFKKTSVSKKVVGSILRLSKGKSKTIVLGFMMISCILSFFMHNLAVIAIMMPIGVEILETLEQEKIKSNIGKCLMIGLPIAAMVGGAGTPIGASMNVLVIGLVESMTGQVINFGQWTVLAAPVAIICTWASYFALTRIYKPETLESDRVKILVADFDALPKMTGREIYTMSVLVISVILMILGTWVPMLTILNVGLGFLVVATLPGIQLVSWKEIVEDVSWEAFIMFGTVNTLVGSLLSTGAVAWLSGVLSSSIGGLPIIVILLLFGLITQVLHALCPVGTALSAMVFPAFAAVAIGTGAIPIAVVALICAFGFGVQYIIPINLPFIITMGTGYYDTKHSILPGIFPAVVMIVLMAVWFPVCCGFLGL
ncbi:MAG TPA: SLC13 family permease [Coriobacteriaceae bacterium]|nr:SLC13 family permease [Coriobacteriaceae bacterium]